MPLLPTTLVDAILRLTDKARADFVGFPTMPAQVAANWAGAARAYFEVALVPSLAILIPNAHGLAETAMRTRMLPDLALGGPAALQNGFAAYALALLPKPGVGLVVPPPAPLALPVLPPVADPRPPALAIAGAVDAWARTGTFSLPGPPVFVPWA